MQQQNEILIYILEHLGLSLMRAVSVLNAQDKKADAEACARIMAKLLSSSVQLGMAYSAKLNVSSDPDKGEAIRFKLTSIAAKALMDRIAASKKESVDADIEILKGASDSLLSFSEHFSLNERSFDFLKSINLDLFSGSELSYLHVVDALLPVIQVVNVAPLEEDVNLLAQKIVQKLQQDSKEMAARLNNGADVELAQLKALSTLAKIFAEIYQDSVVKKQGLDVIWQTYDAQKNVAFVLLEYLLNGSPEGLSSSGGTAPAAPNPAPATPPQESQSSPPAQASSPQQPVSPFANQQPPSEPTDQGQPQPVSPLSPPPAQEQQADAQQGEEGSADNPLSFFKKSD